MRLRFKLIVVLFVVGLIFIFSGLIKVTDTIEHYSGKVREETQDERVKTTTGLFSFQILYILFLHSCCVHCNLIISVFSCFDAIYRRSAQQVYASLRPRASHVPNLMQMNSNKELSSLTLGSAHEKLHV